MEIISIEKQTFDRMRSGFEVFIDKINGMCARYGSRHLNEWLDGQDVCLILNISPRTLQTYRNMGKLGFSQINHKIYYKPDEIEKLLQAGIKTTLNNNANGSNDKNG